MKRMCLTQANADLAEAAEKLDALRKKLAVRLFKLDRLDYLVLDNKINSLFANASIHNIFICSFFSFLRSWIAVWKL